MRVPAVLAAGQTIPICKFRFLEIYAHEKNPKWKILPLSIVGGGFFRGKMGTIFTTMW
jgi:hypothetical protein